MSRSGAQLARYLYLLGRIRAVQLEYSEAKDCLQQAARKVRPPAAVTVCSMGEGCGGPRTVHALQLLQLGCLQHVICRLGSRS